MYKTIISLILWPIWLIYMFISLIILLILLYIVPRPYLFYIIRIWCWGACFFAGQWLVRKGNLPDPDGEPYLYMFNHVSLFDQFMVAAFIGHYVTVVGALEQFKWPIWGTVGKKYGAIPIERKKIKKAMNALDRAEKEIKNGVSLMIAPEGTRTITGEIGEFKKGPFHLARNTKATIIPIGLIGAYDAKNKSDWRLKPGVITARFGSPIFRDSYDGLDVEEIRNLVRERIIDLIKIKGGG
mgnify:CR=1 FL=1